MTGAWRFLVGTLVAATLFALRMVLLGIGLVLARFYGIARTAPGTVS